MESSDSSLTDIQKRVIDAVNRNKDIYNLFLEVSYYICIQIFNTK